MKAQPTYDKLVVDKVITEKKEEKVGGIYLPGSQNDKVNNFAKGTVIKAGPGRQNTYGDYVPMSCKEGDEIMFGNFAGQEIEIEGKTYWLLSDQEVLFVL